MRAIVSKLKRKLRANDTEERCGLVLKDGSVFQVPNVHPEPTRGFAIPGADLLENEEQLAGTWHTHPASSSILSQDDYRGFSQWPDCIHYIVGQDGVRAYRVNDGVIQEVDLAAS